VRFSNATAPTDAGQVIELSSDSEVNENSDTQSETGVTITVTTQRVFLKLYEIDQYNFEFTAFQ
jgi:hypothetical protein